ncbi:hypothetical protein CQW23_01048 [Capsicum baccatum]|uniref:Ubiquitin-like protease family profile domain-containing protein n=1 Tax=Capsicum baccatum TaxID=33114 RepID=A0A2G2XMG8_CAPBA|nr:hypothetical protein CQW23_01048 [Capsicum baccatum]
MYKKEQCADRETEQQNVDDCGLEKSGQHFSPDVVHNSDKMFDSTKIVLNLMELYESRTLSELTESYSPVPWQTVDNIFIPVNIRDKHHWVLTVLSFSERCIFLYDLYESSSHCAIVLAEIEKLDEIILLCLQACTFYEKKGIDLHNHPRYTDKDLADLFDVLFEEDLTQQSSGSLDCGLSMVTYTEYLCYGKRVPSIEFNPNTLRTRYATLL